MFPGIGKDSWNDLLQLQMFWILRSITSRNTVFWFLAKTRDNINIMTVVSLLNGLLMINFQSLISMFRGWKSDYIIIINKRSTLFIKWWFTNSLYFLSINMGIVLFVWESIRDLIVMFSIGEVITWFYIDLTWMLRYGTLLYYTLSGLVFFFWWYTIIFVWFNWVRSQCCNCCSRWISWLIQIWLCALTS